MLVESGVVKPMAMEGWRCISFFAWMLLKNEVPMGRNIGCKGSALPLEVLIQEVYQSASV